MIYPSLAAQSQHRDLPTNTEHQAEHRLEVRDFLAVVCLLPSWTVPQQPPLSVSKLPSQSRSTSNHGTAAFVERNRYVNLTKFSRSHALGCFTSTLAKLTSLCNLHVDSPISQQRPSLSLPILHCTVNTYTQACRARHLVSSFALKTIPTSLLISGNTILTAPPHSLRSVCHKHIRLFSLLLGLMGSDGQPFHLTAIAELTSTRSGGFGPAFELSKRASGSCIL